MASTNLFSIRRSHPAGSGLMRLLVGVTLLLAAIGCGPGDAPDDFFLFALEEGTRVNMEISTVVAEPEGATASFLINDTLLAEPGDSAEIGTAVEGLHVHGTWQATVPGPEPQELNFSIAFKLTTDSELYEESEEITLHFELEHDHEDDEHDHEEGENGAEHGDMAIASTSPGGGQLTLQYDFEENAAELAFNDCVGSDEQDCSGGTLLFTGTTPGFAPKE